MPRCSLPQSYKTALNLFQSLPKKQTLRRALKQQYGILQALRVTMHPDKTFIGKVKKGFDFLGFHLTPTGVTVSKAALSRHEQKVARLYEQDAKPKRIRAFRLRWLVWAAMLTGGVGSAYSGNLPITQDFGDTCRDEVTETYVNTLSGLWTREPASASYGPFNVRTERTGTSDTGPSRGNTLTVSATVDCYIYAETSRGFLGGRGRIPFHLYSPVLDLSGYAAGTVQLDFDYHLWGGAVQPLHVDISTDGGLTYTNDLIPPLTNNADVWVSYSDTTPLSAYIGQTNIMLRFRATRGSGLYFFQGDAALDNISITGQSIASVQNPTNIPIFGPLGLLAMLSSLLWFGSRRKM